MNLIDQERIDLATSHVGFLTIVQLAFLYEALQQVFLPLLLGAENALVGLHTGRQEFESEFIHTHHVLSFLKCL